jgi:hypothetical protein
MVTLLICAKVIRLLTSGCDSTTSSEETREHFYTRRRCFGAKSGGNIMRKIILAGIASLAIVSLPVSANAGERTVTGAAIGAGAGAVVAGPVGAVVGGGIGAWVGGPRISRSRAHKHCWHDRAGVRHCRWR